MKYNLHQQKKKTNLIKKKKNPTHSETDFILLSNTSLYILHLLFHSFTPAILSHKFKGLVPGMAEYRVQCLQDGECTALICHTDKVICRSFDWTVPKVIIISAADNHINLLNRKLSRAAQGRMWSSTLNDISYQDDLIQEWVTNIYYGRRYPFNAHI